MFLYIHFLIKQNFKGVHERLPITDVFKQNKEKRKPKDGTTGIKCTGRRIYRRLYYNSKTRTVYKILMQQL